MALEPDKILGPSDLEPLALTPWSPCLLELLQATLHRMELLKIPLKLLQTPIEQLKVPMEAPLWRFSRHYWSVSRLHCIGIDTVLNRISKKMLYIQKYFRFKNALD